MLIHLLVQSLALAKAVDSLIAALPLNGGKYHLIQEMAWEIFERVGLLINIGRETIAEVTAVAACKQADRIYAARLDNFAFEPEVDDRVLGSDRAVLNVSLVSANSGQRMVTLIPMCINSLSAAWHVVTVI